MNIAYLKYQIMLAQIRSVSDFKAAIGSVVGIILILTFVTSLVLYIVGVSKKESDPAGAKNAIMLAAMLAGGSAVITILFIIFGQSGAVVTPSYN